MSSLAIPGRPCGCVRSGLSACPRAKLIPDLSQCRRPRVGILRSRMSESPAVIPPARCADIVQSMAKSRGGSGRRAACTPGGQVASVSWRLAGMARPDATNRQVGRSMMSLGAEAHLQTARHAGPSGLRPRRRSRTPHLWQDQSEDASRTARPAGSRCGLDDSAARITHRRCTRCRHGSPAEACRRGVGRCGRGCRERLGTGSDVS